MKAKTILLLLFFYTFLSQLLAQNITQYSGIIKDSQNKEYQCTVGLNGANSGNLGYMTLEIMQGTAVLEGRLTNKREGAVTYEGLLNINGVKIIEFGFVIGGNILGIALKQNGQLISSGVLTKVHDTNALNINPKENQNLDPLLFGFWEGERDANSTRSKYLFVFMEGGLMNCMKSEFWASGYGGGSSSFNSQSPMVQEPWAKQLVNEGARWYSKNNEIWIKTPGKKDYILFNYQSNGYQLQLQSNGFQILLTKMEY